MRIIIFTGLLILPFTWAYAQKKGKIGKNQKAVIASIDSDQEALIALSDKIWSFEEVAFREDRSAKALADYAASRGFQVKTGVAEMPTALVAEFGSGKPVIGIMGEYDALPGLSQKTVSEKDPVHPGAPGHGCGHNLFGTASLGAAVAIKELIERGDLKGTVRFYGTPAEEKFFGKLWMIRAGLFDDVDVMMDWHPGAKTEAHVQSSLALVDFMVEFYGQAAHGASDPWNGRSAGDALELYTNGINYLREHVRPSVRMHYHIQDAGKVVNVVPDYARIMVRVRDSDREGMQLVWKRVEEMAEGAAIMANVDYQVSLISGIHEVLVNRTGGAQMQKNLEYLGPIIYTAEEVEFARQIQKATGKEEVGLDASINPLRATEEHPSGGSTDVGDVSFVVPTVRLSVTTAPADTPWHSWAVVACSGMSIGHKGLLYAAKTLGMTMVDLFEDEKLRQEVREEFLERKGDYVYQGMLPEGPPPLEYAD